MALKTALVPEPQARLLGCIDCDQSQNSTAEKGTTQVQVPAEMSGALSSFSYAADCFYSKSNGRKPYRKKNKSKAKLESKRAEKVFPEELIGDTSNELKSPMSNKHSKFPSSTDFRKHDLSPAPAVRPSHSCNDLKNFTDSHSHNSEISNVNKTAIPGNKHHDPHKSSNDSQSVSSKNNHGQIPKGRATSKNSVVKNKNNLNTMRKKDQTRMTWKKCQKGRSTESRIETMSLPDHVHFDTISQMSSVPSLQAALSCDELAVMAEFSSKQNKVLDAGDMLHRGICIESSQRDAEDVSSEYQHSVFSAEPVEVIDIAELDKADGYQNAFGQSNTNRWKTMQGPKAKSFRRHNEPLPFQEQSKSKFYSKDRSAFDPFHPWMMPPRMKPVVEKHLQQDWSDASYFESNINFSIRHGQDFTQHQSSRKWIPVCKKNTSIPQTHVSAKDNMYNSIEEHKGTCLESDAISISVPNASSCLRSHNTEMASLIEQSLDASCTEAKVECPEIQNIKNCTRPIHAPGVFQHRFITPESVEQAFVSSYKLQLTSEGTGYPLAQFERLMWSATPAVASSVLSKTPVGSSSDLLSIILCKEHTSDISLHSVWDWYEEPGNYGLKVDVNHSQMPELEGCVGDTPSFQAHFVPLLSAIQLFGYGYPSSSFGKSQKYSLEAGNPATLSSLEAENQSKIINSMGTHALSNIDIHDISNPDDAAAPSELLFEFFESEQPQRRKPLHNKIMELTSEGTSNYQVFGDPSKLDDTNLDDLHPASWFSVAWYPIYRIPEGKMRAAFLTYHSLGYFVQRCTGNDIPNMSPLSFALPVIGLQSYNAQGELWLSPNTEIESAVGELTSAVLKERLRILEENALFFARGMVSKDHIMVTNRQPDFEFFMARKG